MILNPLSTSLNVTHTHTHTLKRNPCVLSGAAVGPDPLIPVDGGGDVCSDICFSQCGPVLKSPILGFV